MEFSILNVRRKADLGILFDSLASHHYGRITITNQLGLAVSITLPSCVV